jgi:hypothetical protein
MKIDERMYREEIMFCSKIAATLGYDQQVMFELLLHVKAAAMTEGEMAELKKLVQTISQALNSSSINFSGYLT